MVGVQRTAKQAGLQPVAAGLGHVDVAAGPASKTAVLAQGIISTSWSTVSTSRLEPSALPDIIKNA
jgi:hypothetical protein